MPSRDLQAAYLNAAPDGNQAPAGVYNAAGSGGTGEIKGDGPTLARNARMGHPQNKGRKTKIGKATAAELAFVGR